MITPLPAAVEAMHPPSQRVENLLRVLVVDGHPRENSYCAALARAYADGAASAGHECRHLELRNMQFDLHERETGFLEEELKLTQEDLQWAEHVVFVFPGWWGMMPALFKGWLDRVLTPGFAFERLPEGGWRGLLCGRTAHVIITLDTPTLIYRRLLGAPGLRGLRDATLLFCGFWRVTSWLVGPIHASTPEQRQKWLSQAAQKGSGTQRAARTGWRVRARAWLKVMRPQFYVFPWLALTAGAVIAAGQNHHTFSSPFQWGSYLAACAGALLMEFITVLTNELEDESSDRRNRHYGPFTGGSRAVVDGLLSTVQVRRGRQVAAGLLLAMAGVACLTIPGSAAVILLLLGVGCVLGLGYSVEPLRFSRRGWGEVVVAFTHSVLVVLVGYVSQARSLLDAAPWLIALPMFFAVLPSIILAGFPDAPADSATGKRTLAVRWGRSHAALLAMVATAAAAVVFIAAGGANLMSRLFISVAVCHAIAIIVLLHRYRRAGAREGRIDGLLAITLTFMVWPALEPLVRAIGALWR